MTLPETYLDHSLFKHLSDREKAVFQANASLITFEHEELFIKSDTLLFSTYYILEGQVKLKDSHNKLSFMLGSQDVIGLIYLYTKEPLIFSATGVAGTKIIQIENNVLRKFTLTNSQFLVDIYNKSHDNIRHLSQNLLKYRAHKISGAFAEFLLYYHDKNCLNFLTQKEISEVLGYSRENVCKCMNDFGQAGYIEYKEGSITILDMDALKSIRQFG